MHVQAMHKRYAEESSIAIAGIQKAAVDGENVFESLLEAVKTCTLGQLSEALFEVGGAYRRNM